ncbi:MAG: hypothetical protein QM802_03280 [Agriterribacter sp.]
MDEQIKTFNETQLKRVGMGEAFTEELQKKMDQRLTNIQHSFTKNYDGDQMDVKLHLKKSTNSDHYYLNKFDASLQKQGQTARVNQTFYVSNNNRYTSKEAYNLLAGRSLRI